MGVYVHGHKDTSLSVVKAHLNELPVKVSVCANKGQDNLTKCCEPLQKLRVGLGTCKTGLSPPVSLYY